MDEMSIIDDDSFIHPNAYTSWFTFIPNGAKLSKDFLAI